MGKVFACFSIALHNFKKWAVNPRLYILLLMEVLYLHSRLSPVGELCARTGYKVTPYLLPFLLDEGSAVMMLFLGVVRCSAMRRLLRTSSRILCCVPGGGYGSSGKCCISWWRLCCI